MRNLYTLMRIVPILCLLAIGCSPKSISEDTPPVIDGVTFESGNWELDLPAGEAGTSLGMHRAVIAVNSAEILNRAHIPWRRRDSNPQNKDLILVGADSGSEIENLSVIHLDNAYCDIVFQANGEDTLYLYYFPYQSTGGYYPTVNYLNPEDKSDPEWQSQLSLLTQSDLDDLPAAQVVSIQSLNDFHSFYPMEIIATLAETEKVLNARPGEFLLFPEYREFPIRMRNHLPYRWVSQDAQQPFEISAKRGEYVTFQIGVFAPFTELKDLKIMTSQLSSDAGAITCFNTEGIDLNGERFTKTVNVARGEVQPLWFGIDVDDKLQPGRYEVSVAVKPAELPAKSVKVMLTVTGKKSKDHGDDQPENMGRLRWLNSAVGTDPDFIIKPYSAVEIAGTQLNILGRQIVLKEDGLPEQLMSFFTEEMTGLQEVPESVLSGPIVFNVFTTEGIEVWHSDPFEINQPARGSAEWRVTSRSRYFEMQVMGRLEYDGMLNGEITLIARQDVSVKDIVLTVPYTAESAEYILGLGYKGRKRPEVVDWKWDVTNHHEGVWLGAVNRGLQYVLRDQNYERPLNTNFYQAKPLNLPPSWYNHGKGGIQIQSAENGVVAKNYSGSRMLQRGDTLHFHVRFLITPFRPLDTSTHFNTRFVHKYVPVDSVKAWGGTVVNIHHANAINPYINYPFFALDEQSDYIEEAHRKGIKVKLYYTIREITYKCYELFALRSLGDEVLNDGQGGGHPWLQEHLEDRYHKAWHAWRVDDAAILNKGTSRWTNYYVEGLNWLARNQKIDGLYLDDIAFSRETVKRMMSVLHKQRDDVVIDLHSANQFNQRDGFINSAFLYMEHFPYVNRLWFGEYFEYDRDADYWMTEVSGIPFGLMGEMLQDGGHPYRGMLYGMTTRLYGDKDPRPIWRLFDAFNIESSRMIGYWVKHNPVKTDNAAIPATVYVSPGKTLIALASWEKQDDDVHLIVDWQQLGLKQERVKITVPELHGLQPFQEIQSGEPIRVPKEMGLLLLIEEIRP